MKFQVSLVFLLIFLAFAKSSKFVDSFEGDFEIFSCSGSSRYKALIWNYDFSDGHEQKVDSADIAEDAYSNSSASKIIRKSYIKIKSKALQKINCYGVEENKNEVLLETWDIRIQDLKKIDGLEEPTCDESPKIILRRWDNAFKSQYWVSHYVTNNNVHIPLEVDGFKLTCIASESIKWHTTQNLTGFQYWTRVPSENNKCFSAVLVIHPLTSLAGQKFICGKNRHGSYTEISLPTVKNQPEFDFNKTQECIEHLGTTIFGSQALTWATTGTSLLSVGMMVGIVFLKKQLDKQKEQNTNNTSNNTQNVGGNAPSAIESQA